MNPEYSLYLSKWNMIAAQYFVYVCCGESLLREELIPNHNIYAPARYMYYSGGNIFLAEYLIFNKRHNPRGPAKIIYYLNNEVERVSYYSNNRLHNRRGPAIIGYHRDGKIGRIHYYLRGREYTKQRWLVITGHQRELSILQKAGAVLQRVFGWWRPAVKLNTITLHK
jgi:hypothetical protein